MPIIGKRPVKLVDDPPGRRSAARKRPANLRRRARPSSIFDAAVAAGAEGAALRRGDRSNEAVVRRPGVGFLALLLAFLPLLLLVVAVIRLESPGPAIFRQRRTGYRGRVFTIYQFRTMTVTEDGAAVRQATRDDARVTAVEAMLRKFSVDELPQLWNVLRGDMSIVGPRPHALAHDEYFEP